MAEFSERVRRRAYHLWQEDGSPQGRGPDDYYDRARELVAIEDNQKLATKPASEGLLGPYGEPVEPLETIENIGELPGITDQGDRPPYPRRGGR
jgi:hypothetical protein